MNSRKKESARAAPDAVLTRSGTQLNQSIRQARLVDRLAHLAELRIAQHGLRCGEAYIAEAAGFAVLVSQVAADWGLPIG